MQSFSFSGSQPSTPEQDTGGQEEVKDEEQTSDVSESSGDNGPSSSSQPTPLAAPRLVQQARQLIRQNLVPVPTTATMAAQPTGWNTTARDAADISAYSVIVKRDQRGTGKDKLKVRKDAVASLEEDSIRLRKSDEIQKGVDINNYDNAEQQNRKTIEALASYDLLGAFKIRQLKDGFVWTTKTHPPEWKEDGGVAVEVDLLDRTNTLSVNSCQVGVSEDDSAD